MGEMVDRVTEAVWEGNPFLSRWEAERLVRITIRAMRVPTEAVIRAGSIPVASFDYHRDLSTDTAEDAWQAMIDAALRD
jgi:benzoyl-CoA reductase/2-hydroxyglutaryl-CoA dehydratase subunit BcrC/BadD/HgdB